MRQDAPDESAFAYVDNRYYDGPHYDQRYATYTHDTEFWCALAESTGRDVLELGAGTGRLSIPIAERGLNVVGLDISPSMIRTAKAKLNASHHARFVLGDMRTFELDCQFDLVLIACSSVCHLLSDSDAVRCFTSVRRHLRPGGTFAADLASPQQECATADGTWHPRFRYPDPAGKGEVVVRGRRCYDPRNRLLTDTLMYEFTATGHVEQANRVSRMYPLSALATLLEEAGFHIVESYGGFDRQPLTATSRSQLLICSAPADGRMLHGPRS